MLARFILALLLAAFAFPAAAPAACHDASASQARAGVMDMTAMDMTGASGTQHAVADHAGANPDSPDRKATPPHGCIGCVPPSNWSAARILGGAPRGASMLVERAAVLDLGTGVAPGLRPPRGA